MAIAGSSSIPSVGEEEEYYGFESGWVEARTSCDHLPSLCSDLTHIPIPDSPCTRCQNPSENWLCLSCKDVLCSRFVNKHMVRHHQETGHCLALSFSDLSVWCFACESYLDVQAIQALQPVYEVAHLLKFGQRPPFRTIECSKPCDPQKEASTSGS
ncbi:putative histone deacetylase 6 [Iris pallida]|uniref:Histone deacetylase 6 n=1 Tax=Iris pallida TaxID=29817 RepID=A0AAX6FIS9_IRIPA|nr:putative histone deacetylase 6 [Iris pallida]